MYAVLFIVLVLKYAFLMYVPCSVSTININSSPSAGAVAVLPAPLRKNTKH